MTASPGIYLHVTVVCCPQSHIVSAHSLVPSNVLTITKACLVDNSVSVQWMVSEAVSMYVE